MSFKVLVTRLNVSYDSMGLDFDFNTLKPLMLNIGAILNLECSRFTALKIVQNLIQFHDLFQ